MATVVEIRGKTEQRVRNVIETLRNSSVPLSYEDLQRLTGSTYDALLYICTTLCEVGQVERTEVAEGPGRPKVFFKWRRTGNARAVRARSA